MPVYHFTYHAYRSWRLDNPKGYIQRGEPGIQPPNEALAADRERRAKDPPVLFTLAQQALLIDSVREIASRRQWRTHGVAATPSHVHVVVSWRSEDDAEDVNHTFKRVLGWMLSKDRGTIGNRWFSRGDKAVRVEAMEHLRHLLLVYLPKHAKEHGIFWCEPENGEQDQDGS